MGIARFYRWLSERYPLINENITADQIPEFDNFYLDMNGIIHNCSHNNTGGLCVKDENDVFVEAFKYIVRLVQLIRPRKLLYMAVDGCAPRAKMNQQRARRFRAANDAREGREKAEEMGEEITGTPFDSNCITPGTEFMAKLTEHLQFFVQKQMNNDPVWQTVSVILSGPEVPGEGEHKIMDYIRLAKSQPGYDPNTRHCLYGLDADLIMLSLASHEPHFALLREEVVFGRQETKTVEQRSMAKQDRFQLLHISLLREYLELEFSLPEETKHSFIFNAERVIDDFILFCVLVGNDFLPHLPFAEISENGLHDLFEAYKQHLRNTSSPSPWLLKNCGEIDFEQLRDFLVIYARTEEDKLATAVDDSMFVLGKRRLVGPSDAPNPVSNVPDAAFGPPVSTPEDARLLYYEVKFDMDVQTHGGTQKRRGLFQSYLEGLQWVMFYYFRGPDRASWSWYYPYYHAPMVCDIIDYDKLPNPNVELALGEVFKPFQQLMAVLPAPSKTLLPECFQWLFDSAESPILDFYPAKFEIDIDGVKVPWGGVTMIPWICPSTLLKAMDNAEKRGPALTQVEKKRNSFGVAHCFRHDQGQPWCHVVESSMPERFADILESEVRVTDFRHPPLPKGVTHFINSLLPGCDPHARGFPTLRRGPLSVTYESGIKVFQFESRNRSMILHLNPSTPPVPGDDAIKQLLKAPYVQIDYPFIHRGKVVSVMTSHTKYFPNGKTAPCNSRDTSSFVRELTGNWRRRGLVLDFDSGVPAGDVAAGRGRIGQQGASEASFLSQPVVEVRPAEAAYVDNEGRLQYRFKSESEHQLFHLVQVENAVQVQGPRTLSERFPPGTPVLCIAKDTDLFGHSGRVERTTDDPITLEARFEGRRLSGEEQADLQQRVRRVAEEHNAGMRWNTLTEVATKTELHENVVRMIFGSVKFRGAENVREDVGMSFMIEQKPEKGVNGDMEYLCLPCYSVRVGGRWLFSDLAVQELSAFNERFPGLFKAIKDRRSQRGQERDIDARAVFPDVLDLDYYARQLVKYCNSRPFKQLRLAPGQYMALPPAGVADVARTVDETMGKLASRPSAVEHVRGYRRLYKAEDTGSRPPSDLFSGEDMQVGQRGVYIKSSGLVACGTKGTIIGVYGTGPDQVLELLLDEDSFGGNDLRGRAPAMRGLQVPSSAFLPLPRLRKDQVSSPWERETSEQKQTNTEAASVLLNLLKSPPHGPAAEPSGEAGEPPPLPGGGVFGDNPSRSTSSSTDRIKGRMAAQLSAPAQTAVADRHSAPSAGALPVPAFNADGERPAAASSTPAPRRTAAPPRKGASGRKGAGGDRSSDTDDVWAKAFDDLLGLPRKDR